MTGRALPSNGSSISLACELDNRSFVLMFATIGASGKAVTALALGLLLLIGTLSADRLRESDSDEVLFETAYAVRREFVRVVPAIGDVATYRPATVFNDCRAERRRIIEVVPHGSWVKKGDVVVVLDSSEFVNELSRPVLAVIADDARVTKAEASEVIQELQNEGHIETVHRQAIRARELLKAFEQAESVNEMQRLTGDVRMKAENLGQTRDDLEDKKRLAIRGIVTTSSVARADTRLQRTDRELDLARGAVALQERYEHPGSLIQMRSTVRNSQREIERTDLRNDLALTMARFQTLSFRKYRAGWQQYVDRLKSNIAACTMRAPRAGQVIYPTEDSDQQIEVGRTAYYKQRMFSILDRSRLTIVGRVSERHFYNLRTGQPVNVTVAASPGRILHGKVSWMSNFAVAYSRFTPHLRYHRVEVLLDDDDAASHRLFPGMSAEMEILVDRRDQILQVPVAAVFEHNGEYAVIVKQGHRLTRRVIEIGTANERFIEVFGGLKSNEEVVIDSAESQRAFADTLL
jgi:HlyD family secretion protein